MQKGMKVACSWSGGKDSCYSLMTAMEQGAVPKVILNMMNENGKISRSHGLPLNLLEQQAFALGLPIQTSPATWNDYQESFIKATMELRSCYDIEAVVFGDIDLQIHREWEEMVCSQAGVRAVL